MDSIFKKVIKAYKKGDLKEKVRRKVVLNVNYMFEKNKTNLSQKEIQNNWKCSLYLKKKYGKFLKQIPMYQGTNKFSNKIWWCWLQGEENAPELNKACLNSLREHLKDREIIVITEDNFRDYIDFPEYILEKYRAGIIGKAHFADLMRLQLLIKHGGAWIDSSVYCTDGEMDIFEEPLFVFKNWKRGEEAINLSNWFISSEIGNPILMTTRDLLFEYWRRTNKVINYYFFHLFFTISCEKYPQLWNNVPNFPNLAPHVLQFEMFEPYTEKRLDQIKKQSSFHKLSQKLEDTYGYEDNFYKRIIGIKGK